MIKLTVTEAMTIQARQVAHYVSLLTAEQAEAFHHLVRKANAQKVPLTGSEVPRGVVIEALYYQARGMTEADHAAYLRSLD